MYIDANGDSLVLVDFRNISNSLQKVLDLEDCETFTNALVYELEKTDSINLYLLENEFLLKQTIKDYDSIRVNDSINLRYKDAQFTKINTELNKLTLKKNLKYAIGAGTNLSYSFNEQQVNNGSVSLSAGLLFNRKHLVTLEPGFSLNNSIQLGFRYIRIIGKN